MTDAAETLFVPKRGRPSKKQVKAIERAILETATRLFFDGGSYDAVSMETVAFVAGVAKGTLYARYPTKEDLFAAVAQDRIQAWAAVPVSTADIPAQDVAGRLRAHARNIAKSFANPEVEALQRVLFSAGSRFPNISRTLLQQGFLYAVKRIGDDLAGIPGKHYRDPHTVAAALASSIIGWQMQHWHEPSFSTRAIVEFADRVGDIFLLGEATW